MSLVPMKVSNNEIYSALRTRILPLALISILFAKVVQLEKENGDWACNHVKLTLAVNDLEEQVKALTKQHA